MQIYNSLYDDNFQIHMEWIKFSSHAEFQEEDEMNLDYIFNGDYR
tara:strand:- start:1919 stop:2053 length:135 start_codon:yes stop_codon:yes gene_type:complete